MDRLSPADNYARNVAIIGSMGAGKSTVGRLVAERSSLDFVDVDLAIIDRTSMTVKELWETGGEGAYRQLESLVCLEALGRGNVVLATPGGAVVDPAVRGALSDALVVWLRVPPEVLARRVAGDQHRPLLGADPLAVLTALSAQRAELYNTLADLVLDEDQITPQEAAAMILKRLDTEE